MILLALLLAQDPVYDTAFLDAGARADTIVTPDLDGDGAPDLVVQSGRDLHLFLNDKGLPPRPTHTLRLDGSVFLWTFGTVEAGRRPALLTAGTRALQAHAFEGRGWGPARDLVVHPSLFDGITTDGRAPAHVDFAPDLDRDGRADLLLFQKDSILVFKRHADGDFRCADRLSLPPDVSVTVPWVPGMKLTEAASVPVLAFGDVDGDGRADLSYYRDEAIGIFHQTAAGGFKETAAAEIARKKKRERFLKLDLPPWIGDFNKDGLIDLAVCFPSKGRVQVYYGGSGRTDFAQPDEVMKVADGWSSGVYTEDLDGDGRTEMVMGVIRKFGITGGIQVFLSGKVDIELHIYPMQASGRFTKDPVQEIRFTIPFSVHLTRTSGTVDVVFRPNFRGDFNGDGRRDMIAVSDPTTLLIYPGAQVKMIEEKPSGKIVMNPPEGTVTTDPFIADFNRDGISDLVLRHTRVGGAQKHALELKLSRR